jgi:hypothetical protein
MIPSCQRNLLLMPQGLGEVGGGRKPWKCRPEESPENQNQVFRPSLRSWKSLRDSHIPTATMTAAYTFKPKTQAFEEIIHSK